MFLMIVRSCQEKNSVLFETRSTVKLEVFQQVFFTRLCFPVHTLETQYVIEEL